MNTRQQIVNWIKRPNDSKTRLSRINHIFATNWFWKWLQMIIRSLTWGHSHCWRLSYSSQLSPLKASVKPKDKFLKVCVTLARNAIPYFAISLYSLNESVFQKQTLNLNVKYNLNAIRRMPQPNEHGNGNGINCNYSRQSDCWLCTILLKAVCFLAQISLKMSDWQKKMKLILKF